MLENVSIIFQFEILFRGLFNAVFIVVDYARSLILTEKNTDIVIVLIEVLARLNDF